MGDLEEGSPGAGFWGRESRLPGLCAGMWMEEVLDVSRFFDVNK